MPGTPSSRAGGPRDPRAACPGRATARRRCARNAGRRADGGSGAAAITAPITCGAGRPWRSSSRTSGPRVGDDAVAGPVEAVGVGLEAVAQRDARHARGRPRRRRRAAAAAPPARRRARRGARPRPRRAAPRRTPDRWSAGTWSPSATRRVGMCRRVWRTLSSARIIRPNFAVAAGPTIAVRAGRRWRTRTPRS